MKRVEILINGEAYPCMQTAGAMLRFKSITDKEVSEIRPQDLSDLITFLYCCVQSGSAREKKEFKYSLEEFADFIGPEELNQWQAANNDREPQGEDSKKK